VPKEIPLGYVAHYCTICHDINRFSLVRTTTNRAASPAHHAACASCGLRVAVDPQEFRAVLKDEGAELSALVSETSPELPFLVRDRVYMTRLGVAGGDDRVDRKRLLQEPFRILMYIPSILSKRRRLTFADIASMSVIGVIGLLTAAVLVIGDDLASTRMLAVGVALVIVLLIMSVVVGQFLERPRRRRCKAVLHTMLGKAMRPFKPTEQEVQEVVAWCKLTSPALAPFVEAPELHRAIRALPDTSLNNVDALAHEYPVLKSVPKEVGPADCADSS
jgi:hypothetical protein